MRTVVVFVVTQPREETVLGTGRTVARAAVSFDATCTRSDSSVMDRTLVR